MSRLTIHRLAWTACALALLAAPSQAGTVTVDRGKPNTDIWFYPFATSGGRNPMAVFGAVSTPGSFDNRDGQAYLSFATTPEISGGLGASNYKINAATITLTISNNDTKYDGTYDPVSTYLAGGSDGDAGRPIELYGAGYRNGLTATTVINDTPFTPDGGTQPGTRSVFPTDFLGGTSLNGASRDVSSNVTAATPFNTNPFAIGHVAAIDLNSDGTISALSDVTFDLNLNNPDVVRYLQLSLDSGLLNFLATSLFEPGGVMGSDGGFASFFSAESFTVVNNTAPRLHLEVETIPEPSAVTLLLCGFGLFVAGYRGVRLGKNKEVL